MKKSLILITAICMAMCLAFSAIAVPSASEVVGTVPDTESTYANLFTEGALESAPEENITAKELMSAAVRLHSTLCGGSLSTEYNLDTYYNYALTNGIFEDGVYTSETQLVTKAQVVTALYNAVKTQVDLTEINPLVGDYIPDGDVTASYYNAALCFIEAGIVDGTDEYGSFKPGNNVKRYELAAMIDRIFNPAERIDKDYIEYAGDAPFYLIDDFIMEVPVVNVSNIASGWRYDYTGSVEKGVSGAYANNVTDLSSTDKVSISRTIEPQSDGVLQLETNFIISYGFAGLSFEFVDSDGNVVYVMGTIENDKFFNGEIGNVTAIAREDRIINLDSSDPDYWYLNDRTPMRITLDLDEGKADVYVAGKKVGETYNLGTVKDVAKLRITTGDEERLEAVVNQLHLYKNWHVNDLMRAEMPGDVPLGYETSGNVTVEKIRSQADNQGDHWSAKFAASAGSNSYAKRSFKAISGLAVLETYMLLPTGDDGAHFTITSDGIPVIKVETSGNKFVSGGKELINFSDNIWQLVRIEANTNTQTYSVRIRGKLVAENLPFLVKTAYFNGLEIGITPSSDCVMWFDDVEAYETFEYDDYCPEPVVVENDYYVGMSICNLWRNGSHYGWSYIQPHHEPVTGFYDEGIPEAMDWEIKMLAEHGFDFYNFCWYSGQSVPTDPLKKSRMNDAIHDGYFNAKYSDKLKISLMFENASMRTAGTWDEFEANIWPYWKEWYFSDPRYFTIEEDGKTYTFLTIYQFQYFLQMCNDATVLTESGGLIYDYGDAELTSALSVAAEKLKWMNDDLVASGISDGLIVGFNNNMQRVEDAQCIAAMCSQIGSDYAGVFPYSWGSTASDLDTQLAYIERGYQNGLSAGVDLLALPCIGFNKIGWYHEENYPLIANEDLKTLLEYFRDDYMKRYSSDGGSWKQKYIQFATWNEFGEGHYFYPCDDNGGYAYLDTMAEVLSGDTTGEGNNTMPTQAQKDRTGHLYVGDRMYLRRNYTDFEEAPDAEITTLQYTYNPGTALTTKNEKMYDGWTVSGATEGSTKSSCTNTSLFHSWVCNNGTSSSCTFDYYYNGVLTTTNTDPMMYRTLTSSEVFAAEDADVLYITLEASQPYTVGEFFFVSDHPDLKDDFASNDFLQTYSYSFDILSTGKVTYAIDLTSHAGWKGNITRIRFDLGSLNGNTVKVYDIKFAKFDDSARKPQITVDNIPYVTADYGEIRSWDKNELYIAPCESEHLYRLLHMVYDWPPERDTLTLDTPNGDVVKFTVGSNIAVVNGSNVTLKKNVELYDGVPVIPLLWLLDTCDYNYVYDFTNRTLDVTVADKVIYYDIANGDAESADTGSFYTGNSNISLSIVTDHTDSANKVWQLNASSAVGGVEQYTYIRTDFDWQPGVTYIIDFDARLPGTLANGDSVSSAVMAFNARYADTALASNKYDHNPNTCRANLTTEWQHFSMEYTVADTLYETDTVRKQLTFYIAPINTEGVNVQFDNLTVRTSPLPFSLINGDAEGSETDAWYSANANISVGTESNGNKYWHVEHDGTTSKWTYVRQHTTFEPGVTYYFSVDMRLGKDADGNNATTRVDINARYKDLLKENSGTNIYDHNFGIAGEGATLTTSDSWTTFKGSFTVSMGYTPGGVDGGYDEITFFSNPVNSSTTAVAYDFDNFIVSTNYDDIYG